MSSRFKDLTGQVFGDRTVTGFSHQSPVSKNYYWFATCICGREDVVSGTRLRKNCLCLSCNGRIRGRKGQYVKSLGKPVYFAKCGDYIKIGSSSNVKRRVKDIMSDNPIEVTLLKVDTNHNEEYWHKRLEKYHHKGEWFTADCECEIVDV